MILDLLAIVQPDALDREVNAISNGALLTSSPFALIDPARAAAAAQLQAISLPLWIATILLQIGVLAWFWRSGWSARLRDALRARSSSEFAVRFLFGATLALVDNMAALVPQFFAYRTTRIMGLTELLTRFWLLGWVESTVVTMIVAGMIAAVVLWLADRTHQWYLYAVAGVVGFTLLVAYVDPYVIAPTYRKYVAAPLTPEVAQSAAKMAARAGIPQVPVLEEIAGERSRMRFAYVIGWGGSQRIVISDTILGTATPPELRFVLARSYAWIAANDALHQTLIEAAFIVMGTALAIFIADRTFFRRDDDPVSRLALVGALLGCVYLVAAPLYNGYSRQRGAAADDYGVRLTGDRSAAIRYVVRAADQSLMPICPSLIAHWYFDAHLPAGRRIAQLQGRPDPCARQPAP